MYVKSSIIALWTAASYVVLVFVAHSAVVAVCSALSLSLAAAALAFNIPHDASHGSYSRLPAFNRAMAFAFDLLGASSYVWHWKHDVVHHTYPNITGVDEDISLGPLGRLTPSQPHHPPHRFQHFYLWALYGLILFKWQFVDDFRDVIRGKVGQTAMPRPRGLELGLFLAGKVASVAVCFVIPLLRHPPGVVFGMYFLTAFLLGLVVSVVFQLAHAVEDAEFPVAAPRGRMSSEWAIHQVETTVDFARGSRVLAWYLGGLNFQIEHHLFPKLSHAHYPALAPIVEAVCVERGVRYRAHRTLRAAIASHYRWLRRLANAEPGTGLAAAA